MKRILLIAIIATIGGFSVMAQNNPVNNQTPTTRDHRNLIFDSIIPTNIDISFDDENGLIVVGGLGESEGYHVNVVMVSMPQAVLISDYVNATDNTVDVSMLDNGYYSANLVDPIFGKTVFKFRFLITDDVPDVPNGWGTTVLPKIFNDMKK